MDKTCRKYTGHVIDGIEEGSIAWELNIEAGDILMTVNGQQMDDVFDYQFLTNEELVTLVVRKKNGEEWELEIEKEYEDDLGLIFDNGLMDDYRSCRNKCIFCFIDQMPPGMRETLYFKDDDSRLSFLQGNYVTLTNMSDKDIDRIIRYRLEPINISFQTMNPELRCKMLHNRFAGEALKKVDTLYEAGIEMNGQIVLCKGVNDGAELDDSIRKMSSYLPYLRSVSIVPVGITRYRDGLFPMDPFTREDACEVIDIVEKWQSTLYEQWGLHFIHCSDEWYILAGRDLPEEERYDGYLQLENGVGMLRLLAAEADERIEELEGDALPRRRDLATGILAAPYIEAIASRLMVKYPNLDVQIHVIRNDFFGEKITVAGLITGQDLAGQLKGKLSSDTLLIPEVMLRDGENVFLDDWTTDQVCDVLGASICVVRSSGHSLVNAMLEPDEDAGSRGCGRYELKE